MKYFPCLKEVKKNNYVNSNKISRFSRYVYLLDTRALSKAAELRRVCWNKLSQRESLSLELSV